MIDGVQKKDSKSRSVNRWKSGQTWICVSIVRLIDMGRCQCVKKTVGQFDQIDTNSKNVTRTNSNFVNTSDDSGWKRHVDNDRFVDFVKRNRSTRSQKILKRSFDR